MTEPTAEQIRVAIIARKIIIPFSWRKSLKIAREYFPDIPKTARGRGFLGYVIWNGTGWPSFWEGEPEQHFRKQLQKAKKEFETHGHLLEEEFREDENDPIAKG